MLPVGPARALTIDEAAAWRDRLHADGKRLVFTSGCFDILHAGHVRYLAQARALGDALVVALNGDASVRALKGPQRPVHSQEDRAEVLLALAAVDAVVVFDTPRTTALITAIRPHLFAKGGDYTIDTLNPEERAALEACGTGIRILPQVEGRSTSASLAKMQTPDTATRRPRLAVIGSGAGSNFDAIADAIAAGSLDAEIVLVASDVADSGILEKARRRGLPALFVDPGPHANRFDDAAQKELADRLRAAGADWLLCAGFMRRLKAPVLDALPGRILNVHPSLLPAFPGRTAIDDALAASAKETGCTVHVVTDAIDAGPILARTVIPILPDDTHASLRARINAAERDLFPRTVAAVCRPVDP